MFCLGINYEVVRFHENNEAIQWKVRLCFFPIPLFSPTCITKYVSPVVSITSGVFSWQHFLWWGPALFARLYFCEYKERKTSCIRQWNLRKKIVSITLIFFFETKKQGTNLVINRLGSWLLKYRGYKSTWKVLQPSFNHAACFLLNISKSLF